MATSPRSSRVPVESADFAVSGLDATSRAPAVSERGYGERVVETAEERHDRHVEAIEAVLIRRLGPTALHRRFLHSVAEECLDAAETGI